MNKYSLWKYLLIITLVVLGILYALPNLYGEDYAVQISQKNSATMPAEVEGQIKAILQTEKVPTIAIDHQKGGNLLIRFSSTTLQLKARDAIKAALGDDYTVALSLAPKTPKWLQAMGANPMKYGLDLRGGVHLLLDVDVDSLIKNRESGDIRNIGTSLRGDNIRYAGMTRVRPNGIVIRFQNSANRDQAFQLLPNRFPDYLFTRISQDGKIELKGVLRQDALTKIRDYAISQTITILNSRVNELGVSDVAVQRQGLNQISVDLPGIQDSARAKNLLGKTATLRFTLVDTQNDPIAAEQSGDVPLGDTLYKYEGRPVLLRNQAILRGSAITYATGSMGESGRPAVQIRLGGGGEGLFHRATADNIGKPLAVIYVETQLERKKINGKEVNVRHQNERVISVATIQSALGNNFQITNLDSMRYAQNLALLLRSGAYQAPVSIIQERTIGPSMGRANIHKGVLSVEIGGLLVILFMAFYYRLFGLIADTALVLNVLFIVSILSLLGGTLTLPGIAGIVLTVGMAVDANVLINERIREELRNGMSPQAAIHAGYERAFVTIVDSNITTLIVGVVLFAFGGGGPVKGFAVTLIIGILTSMVTAMFFTRGLVNLVYGGRSVKKLSIGINVKSTNANLLRA